MSADLATSRADAKVLLPWFVTVSPEFYDDDHDTGFGWEGWAVDADEAVVKALEQCHLVNEREPDERKDDVDPERAKVHVVEVDFHRLAGSLVHWARTAGVSDAPLWRMMEEAVRAAGLPVVPFPPLETI